MIKFSIVIPVYNTEKVLSRCLNNVINQTYENIEIIIVNDGSSDGSIDICKQFMSDSRVKLIDKENEGVSKARNTGIMNSTGNYIIFVDSDDVPNLDMCEQFYNVITEKKYDLVISDIMKVDENLVPVSSFNLNCSNLISVDYIGQEIEKMYNCGLLNCIYGKCYKRNIINELFDTNTFLGEDLLFNLEYIKTNNIKEIYYLNKTLYNYILYTNNTLSSSYNPKSIDSIDYVFNKCKKLFKEIWNFDYCLCLINKYIIDCLVIAERIARDSNKNIKEKTDEINRILEISKLFELKKISIKGLKFSLYYELLKFRMYRLFIVFSNIIRRRK